MQAEYFDAERPADEVREFYRSLNSVNRLFGFAQPFQHRVPKLLEPNGCQRLSLLDVGAGDGLLGRVLSEWAAQRQWDWRVTNLDLNWSALSLNAAQSNVAGSALALPFRSQTFDVVIVSQMAHHLSDREAEQLLREAWRVCRRALVLSDLHRNLYLYLLLWLLFRLRRHPREFCSDALLSVKRGWRTCELHALAKQARLPCVEVTVQFGARIILTSVRQ